MTSSTESPLEELQNTCRLLVAASPSPAFCTLTNSLGEHRVLATNPACRRAMNIDDSESRPTRLEELFNPASSPLLAEKLTQCVATGIGLTFDWQYPNSNGTHGFLTSLTPMRAQASKQVLVFATAMAISEQEQANTGFGMLEFALNEINEIAMILDEDAQILYVNDEASRALGFSRERLLNMTIPQLDTNWPEERWPEIWHRLIAKGALSFESKYRTLNERVLDVEINARHLEYRGRNYAFALSRDISERKRFDEESHARSEEFRILVEHSPDLIIRYDLTCRRIYANPAFVRLTDMPPKQLLGKTPTEQQVLLVEPNVYESKIQEVIDTGQTTDLTFRWLDKTGVESWSHARFVPECDSSGAIASVMAICHDITSLKKTERQLATLVNNLPDMVMRFDVEGRHLYVNPTVCRTFAKDAERFLGTPALGKDVAGKSLVEWIQEAASSGKPSRCEIIWQTLGQAHHFDVQHVPEMDQDGQVISVLVIATDITALMQAQHALRESEERYRQIFDNTRESLFLLEVQPNAQFLLLQVNPAFEQSVGVESHLLTGKPVSDALSADTTAVLNTLFQQCVSTGGIIDKEITLNIGQGARTYQTTLIPVRNDSGMTHRIVGMMRDITERLESEHAMRRLTRALKTLSSGNEALIRATNETNLLENMCQVVVEIGEYHSAWIGFTLDNGAIQPTAWAGDKTIYQGIQHYHDHPPTAADPATLAVRTGREQVVHDIETLPACNPLIETYKRSGIKACVSLPLSNSEENFGVLAIYSTDNDAYDEQEVNLLKEMAEDLAYGIHALRARMEKERFVERLKESMESTIRALASTVELRDPYTAGHQQRVAELAMEVCRCLQWPEEKIQATYLAGLVHDIGKIAIPAEILSKPGHLNQAEYTLVRTHAEAGYDILKSVDFNWPIAQIVLQHHERLDGSGYPYGLAGEVILSEARVLSVCDVVEAMTTHRPYRPGLGVEAAIAEIELGKDRLYDAEVVEACIRVIREQHFQFNG